MKRGPKTQERHTFEKTCLDWDTLETPERAFMRKSDAMCLGAFLATVEVSLR